MIVCILLAAGSGRRFGSKKQFLKINDQTVLEMSLRTIEKIEQIDMVYLVLPKEDMDIQIGSKKEIIKVEGGKERQDSVFNALLAIDRAHIVVVHDSARPFASERMFIESIENVKKGWDGSITAYKSIDTVKEVVDSRVLKTINREHIYMAQTPQSFNYEKLLKAHLNAREKGIVGTDDSYLMEILGYKICINEGSFLNFKITRPQDIFLAERMANPSSF